MTNEKEIKLTPPEGWEIDEEKSSLKDCKIVYKEKKKETFEDVFKKVVGVGSIEFKHVGEKLRNRIKALSKMAIVAEYVNDSSKEKKYSILVLNGGDLHICFSKDTVSFTSEEAAKRAIDILGEDVIRTACQ